MASLVGSDRGRVGVTGFAPVFLRGGSRRKPRVRGAVVEEGPGGPGGIRALRSGLVSRGRRVVCAGSATTACLLMYKF